MSKSIDERVVRMEFENQNFEANAKATMSTIDKLKEKLNFKGAAKGVQEIDNAAKKINLNPLASSVDVIAKRFTNLGIVGVTALQNITNQALNAAKNLVNQFTLAPIMSGFREYETQIGAVQTILANTSMQGTTINQVSAALDELNTYADKTIYNFTEMTRNIGTFTAAGVELQTSVEAIKGIANLAAMSGSTSNQASTAMYQLSQALAAGRVSLQDWNSVVNAGMGGKVFQEALMRTAEVMGIAVDRSVSFRESISTTGGKASWLTSDVLLQTLRQFTGDMTDAELAAQGFTEAQIEAIQAQAKTANEAATQVKTLTQLMDTTNEAVTSGWTQTWEILFGDFEEAKYLFTDISNAIGTVVGEMSDARNNLLSGGLSSGWKQFLNEGISNADDFIESIRNVSEEYGVSEDQLDSYIEKHGSFEQSLKEGWLNADMLAAAVSDYSDRLQGMSAEELKAAGYTEKHRLQTLELNEAIQAGTVDLEKFTMMMARDSGRENIIEGLRKAFESLLTILTPVKNAFEDVFEAMTPEELYSATEAFRSFFTTLSDNLSKNTTLTNNLYRTFKGLFSIFDIVGKILGGVVNVAFRTFGAAVDTVDEGVTGFTATIGDAIVAFNDWLDSSEVIDTIVEKFSDFLKNSELLEKAIGAVSKGFSSLKSAASSGLQTFRNWVSSIMQMEQVQSVMAAVNDVFTAFRENSSEALSVFAEKVKMAFGAFLEEGTKTPEKVMELLQKLWEFIQELFDNLKDGFSNLGDAGKSFEDAMKNLKQTVSDQFAQMQAVVQGFIDFISTAFSDVGIGEVLTVGFVVSLIAMMKQIKSAVSIFKDVVNTLQGPVGAFNTLLGSISSSISGFTAAMKTQAKANAFKTVAEGIAILAASIGLLTFVDQGKLKEAAITLGIFALGVAGIAKAFGMFQAGSGADNVKSVAMILGISSAILILVQALKGLDDVGMDDMPQKLGVLAAMAAGLTAVVIALNQFATKGTGGLGAGLSSALGVLGVGGAMWLIIEALKGLDEINFSKIENNILGLIEIFGLFSVVAIASSRVEFTNAVGIIAVVLSLRAFLDVLDAMADSIDTGKIQENLESYALIFAAFSAVLLASNFASSKSLSVGGSILMMSAAIMIIAQAMKSLNTLTPAQIEQSGKVITALFAIFTAIMALSKLAGSNAGSVGAGILAMSASIVILSGAMMVLGEIKPEKLTQALVAVTVLMSMFGLLMLASRYASNARKSIMMITGSIAVLAAVMAAMSLISPDRLAMNTAALSVLMGMFALVMKAQPTIKGANSSIVLMTACIAALAGVLIAMSALGVENSIPNAVALSTLMIAMVAALRIGQGINESAATKVALAVSKFVLIISALGIVVTAIAGAMSYIPNIDEFIARAQKFVTGIFGVLGSMVGGFIGGVLGGAATVFTSTLPLIGTSLSVFGVSIQPFIAAVRGIDNSAVDGTKRLFDILTTMAGGTFVSAISNVFTGGSLSLSAFASQLSDFAANIKTFCEDIAGIDESALEKGVTVIQTFSALADALPSQNGLLQVFTGGQMDFSEFGTQLGNLASGLKQYCNQIQDLDTTNLDSSVEAISTLAGLGDSMPNMVGLADYLTGGQMDLKQFGNQLYFLAYGLVDYCNQIKSLDTTNLDTSVDAISKLAALGPDMPNFVGFAQVFTGGQMDLSTFGGQITYLGEGLASYCESIKSLDTTNLDTSIGAIQSLAALGPSMPYMSGFIDYFIGGKMDLADFGTQITYLGSGIASYCTSIQGVDTTNLDDSIAAIKDLAAVAPSMPNLTTFISYFTGGQMSLADFGTQIGYLGSGLAAYCESIKDLDTTKVTDSVTALTSLASLYDVMPSIGGIFDVFSEHDMSLSDFGTQLSDLGWSLSGFSSNIASIDAAHMTEVINGLSQLATLFETLSGVDTTAIAGIKEAFNNIADFSMDTILSNFSTGVASITPQIRQMGVTIANAMLEGFNTRLNMFTDRGKQAGINLYTGLNAESGNVRTSATNLGQAAVDALNQVVPSFKTAGQNAGAGFVEGLNEYASKAAEAAAKMANSAVNAVNSALDEHSPSRVLIQSGRYGGEGLALGFMAMIPSVESAASKMTEGAIYSIQSAISRARDVLADSSEMQPTIRPVVDLSDVQAKASMINQAFGINRRYSVAMTASRVSSASSGFGYRQNGNVNTPSDASKEPVTQSFNFTQNNYSPKALNRSEIYRQTNNQFTKLKNKVTGR